mmetsp:Transcript_18880/g.29535  ORF Transcript_18880/g.29535 Transcript_18880/m.29535 type:complete len:230 (-) Transcript_18880:179-868(-)
MPRRSALAIGSLGIKVATVRPERRFEKGGLAVGPNATVTPDLGSPLGLLALPQLLDHGNSTFSSEILVVVVIGDWASNLHHWCVAAASKALCFHQVKEPVLSGFTNVDAQMGLDAFEHVIGSANHAWRGGAHLDVVLANLIPVVHGVEGGNLVYTHGGHVEDHCNLVHSRDWNPASASKIRHVFCLLLGQVQERHDCRTLVVGWILLQDNGNLLVVLGGEIPKQVSIVS